MTGYVAFLRGINVGGRNLIAMPDLVKAFESAGYLNVRSHLQSGNVLFEAASTNSAELEVALDALLSGIFGTPIPTVVQSHEELRETIAHAPAGHDSPELRSEVLFLKRPLTSEQAMQEMPELREGVDAIAAGDGVLYFSRVAAEARKTRINRLMGMPVFKQMTMRTWRTVTRIAEMLEA